MAALILLMICAVAAGLGIGAVWSARDLFLDLHGRAEDVDDLDARSRYKQSANIALAAIAVLFIVVWLFATGRLQ